MPDFNEKVIPVVVKKGLSNQKFRIPFKNSGSQDLDIDFMFAKTTAVIVGPVQGSGEDSSKSSSVTNPSPIEFSAVPSNVKISANSQGILNIGAKLKNSYQLMSLNKE